MTTPERFQRVRDLFDAAMDQERNRRTAWLEEACGDDEDLLAELQRLLVADGLPDEILEESPGTEASAMPPLQGRRIGQYEITSEVGRGGMGTVYRARRADDVFSKDVAFKVVRPERSTTEVIRRFQQEREILASLDHPHIARLLDGGRTEEGLPYFVMEYVEGQPVDTYCDEKKLNVSQRLKLFQAICAAVQYAHQNLVVHRDLKPTNIIVTAGGTVKLLDFGIAKLLKADSGENTVFATQVGFQMMTPEYASPEQLRGEPVTTRSDIYSLGVILYELLTGHPPYRFRRGLLHEMARIVCEQEPTRPSTVVGLIEEAAHSGTAEPITPEQVSAVREGKPCKLKRRLSGDLDNILMMALRKEPDRRYSSVDQFSEDLRRHLEGLPVLAQKDRIWYRTQKFVGRNRVAMAGTFLLLLTLIAGVAETGRQARVAEGERARAEEQRRLAEERSMEAAVQRTIAEAKAREAEKQKDRAERQFYEARRLAGGLLEAYERIKELPGAASASELILGRARQSLERLAVDVPDASIHRDLATTVAALRRLNLEKATAQVNDLKAPPSWFRTGSDSNDYVIGVDRIVFHSGAASAYIRSEAPKPNGYEALMQYFPADDYRGKRLRLTGFVKTAGVDKWAVLWMKVDGKDRVLVQDNMPDRRITGTKPWARYEVVLDVPQESMWIVFGFLLRGKGVVWVDDLQFDIVDHTVAVTALPLKLPPPRPVNLNLEAEY